MIFSDARAIGYCQNLLEPYLSDLDEQIYAVFEYRKTKKVSHFRLTVLTLSTLNECRF